MATTLYPRTVTPGEPKPNTTICDSWTSVSVNTDGGGQDLVGAPKTRYPCDMSLSPGTTATSATWGPIGLTKGTSYFNSVKSFISPPLRGAQTIAGTITVSFDFYESLATADCTPYLWVYVWKADDSGSRGTLLNGSFSGTEANTTKDDQVTYWSGTALAQVSAQDGDRIFIELGQRILPTKSTDFDFYVSWGGSGGNQSYFQFSQDLKFYPGGIQGLTVAGPASGWPKLTVTSGPSIKTITCAENAASGFYGVKAPATGWPKATPSIWIRRLANTGPNLAPGLTGGGVNLTVNDRNENPTADVQRLKKKFTMRFSAQNAGRPQCQMAVDDRNGNRMTTGGNVVDATVARLKKQFKMRFTTAGGSTPGNAGRPVQGITATGPATGWPKATPSTWIRRLANTGPNLAPGLTGGGVNLTVNDKNEDPTANVQRLKKNFVMRFGPNADRPKQGITVTAPVSGWPKIIQKHIKALSQAFTFRGRVYPDERVLRYDMETLRSTKMQNLDNSETMTDADINGATTTTGRVGNCYQFPNNTDYMRIAIGGFADDGLGAVFDHSGITIAAWIYATSFPTDTATVWQYSSDPRLSLYSDGTLYCQYNYTITLAKARTSTTIPLNQWVWVVAKFDPSTKKFKIYFDAIEQPLGTDIAGDGTALDGSTNYVYLGGSSTVSIGGKLDEVYVWKRVLSDAEILRIYLGTTKPSSLPQGITIGDENSGLVQRFVKKFWMRFTYDNADRPQQGITVTDNAPVKKGSWIRQVIENFGGIGKNGIKDATMTFRGSSWIRYFPESITISELNVGAVARLRKTILMTFKNVTALASRGRESITITAPVSGWPQIKEWFVRSLPQGISVNDRNENPTANVQRLKKKFTMTFKNATAGASRGRESITITAPVSGWPKLVKSVIWKLVQGIFVWDRGADYDIWDKCDWATDNETQGSNTKAAKDMVRYSNTYELHFPTITGTVGNGNGHFGLASFVESDQSGHIEGSDGSLFDYTDKITVCVWVADVVTQHDYLIVGKVGAVDGNKPWLMLSDHDGIDTWYPAFYVNGTNGVKSAHGFNDIDDATDYQFIVGQYDKAAGKVRISVNGAAWEEANYANDMSLTDNLIYVNGATGYNSGDAVYDDIYIFNDILSIEEVRRLYNSPYGALGSAGQSLTKSVSLVKKFWMLFTSSNAGRPQQGMTVNDRNENPAANVQRLKKKFVMTFKNATVGASRGRESVTVTAPATGWPKFIEWFIRTLPQGITVSELNTGTIARLRKLFVMTFKNTTAGASRGRESITVTDNLLKRFIKSVFDQPRVVDMSLIVTKITGLTAVVVEEALEITDAVLKRFTRRIDQGVTIVDSFTTRGSKWVRKFSEAFSINEKNYDPSASVVRLKKIIKKVITPQFPYDLWDLLHYAYDCETQDPEWPASWKNRTTAVNEDPGMMVMSGYGPDWDEVGTYPGKVGMCTLFTTASQSKYMWAEIMGPGPDDYLYGCDSLSVAGWFKYSANSGNWSTSLPLVYWGRYDIMYDPAPEDRVFELRILLDSAPGGTGSARFRVKTGTDYGTPIGDWWETTSPTTLHPGVWYFIVGVYDQKNDRVRVAVNGENFTDTALPADRCLVWDDAWLMVDSDETHGSDYVYYDDVMFFLKQTGTKTIGVRSGTWFGALTQEQATLLYNLENNGKGMNLNQTRKDSSGIKIVADFKGPTVPKTLTQAVAVAVDNIGTVWRLIKKFTKKKTTSITVTATISLPGLVSKTIDQGIKVVESLVKGFWMRFANENADRPKLSLTVTDRLAKRTKRVIDQGLTVTESLIKKFVRVISQSVSIDDVLTYFIRMTRTLPQELRVTDNILKRFSKKKTAGITVTDTLSTKASFIEKLSQDLKVSANVLKKFIRDISQALDVEDNLKWVQRFVRTYDQSLRVGDNLKKYFIKVIDQATRVTDVLTLTGRLTAILVQGITVVASRFSRAIKVIQDGFKVTDTVRWIQKIARLVSQGITISDVLSLTGRAIQKIIQGIKVVDEFLSTRGSRWVRSFPQSIRITDTVSWIQRMVKALSLGIRVTDNVFTRSAFVKSLAEALKVTASKVKRFQKVVAQSARVVDTYLTTAGSSFIRRFEEGITVVGSTIKGLVRRMMQGFEIEDVLSLRSAFVTVLAQPIKVVESLTKLFIRVITQPTEIVDNVVVSLFALGAIKLTQAIRVSATTIKQMLRVISDSLTVTDNVLKHFTRTLSEELRVVDNLVSRSLDKVLSQVIEIEDNFFRVVEYVRVYPQGITITDFVSALGKLAIVLTQSLRVTDELLKSLGRKLSDAFTTTPALVKSFYKNIQGVSVLYSHWNHLWWACDGETLVPATARDIADATRSPTVTYKLEPYDANDTYTPGDVTGHYGLATSLPHVGGVVHNTPTIANSTDSYFQPVSYLTVAMWVKVDSLGAHPDYTYLIDKADSWWLKLDHDGTVSFITRDGVGNLYTVTSPTTLSADGEWHLVVGEYHYFGLTQKVRISVDGETLTESPTQTLNPSATPVRINDWSGNNHPTFSFDDVMIWSGGDSTVLSEAVLSQDEIDALWASNSGLNLNDATDKMHGGIRATDVLKKTFNKVIEQSTSVLDAFQNTGLLILKALSQAVSITDNFSRIHDAIRKFVQSITVTDVVISGLAITVVTVVPLAGTFPKPARRATLSCRVERNDGTALSGCTVTAVIRDPDGAVWKTLTMTESAYTPGMYSADFKILGSTHLGVYSVTITAVWISTFNTGTYNGFITIFQGPYAAIHFR